MTRTDRVSVRILLALLPIAAVTWSERVFAMPAFDADGWYTWRVQAADPHSLRCCGTWSGGKMISSGCNLDTGGIASGCSDLGPSAEVQIYALVEQGKVARIRAFSPQCHVETRQQIRDLGLVGNGDSVSRLEASVTSRGPVSDDALAAIASHAGDEAVDVLRNAVRSRDTGIRERALFWLVQSESDEAFEFVEKLITGS